MLVILVACTGVPGAESLLQDIGLQQGNGHQQRARICRSRVRERKNRAGPAHGIYIAHFTRTFWYAPHCKRCMIHRSMPLQLVAWGRILTD
jgi:hypothetical protein